MSVQEQDIMDFISDIDLSRPVDREYVDQKMKAGPKLILLSFTRCGQAVDAEDVRTRQLRDSQHVKRVYYLAQEQARHCRGYMFARDLESPKHDPRIRTLEAVQDNVFVPLILCRYGYVVPDKNQADTVGVYTNMTEFPFSLTKPGKRCFNVVRSNHN